MRHFIKLLLLLVIPFKLFAQDTAVLKKQAMVIVHSVVDSNYSAIIDHTYPRLVDTMGGRDKMLNETIQTMRQLKSQGVIFESADIGSPGKFYTGGKNTFCLIPETIKLKLPAGHVIASGFLLAISTDGGKVWTFMDINKGTKALIPVIFPDFNNGLVIPEIPAPVMTKD